MKAVITGAGGHARSVLEAVRREGVLDVVGCTDPDPARAGSHVDGVPVVGDDTQLETLLRKGVAAACLGVGGVGSNGLRKRLLGHLEQLGFALPAIKDPTALVATSAEVGSASVVLARSVVGPGSVLGRNVIVNTAAVVEHDCTIGDHVHVATGALLGGGVRVEQGAHVGIGAVILQGVQVGAGAVVGGGAVVVRDVAAGQTVVGIPAGKIDARR